MEEGLRVRFWGTRGSMAAPYRDRMEFGGNTSCVSVDWPEGIVVFDGGTGIMELGNRLKEAKLKGLLKKDSVVHIFVSHLHMDHIAGLFMFPCLFEKEMEVELYGPCGQGRSFRERFWAAMDQPFWPVTMAQTAAGITWHDTKDGDIWKLPGEVMVRVMKSNHPNGCVIYRLERKKQSVVYGLDCELGERDGEFRRKYKEFADGCDMLIFDAPYDKKEYKDVIGFGHSFWQQGVETAKECNVKYLYISHHEWGRTDRQLEDMEREAQAQVQVTQAGKWNGSVSFAREGTCVSLEEAGGEGVAREGACVSLEEAGGEIITRERASIRPGEEEESEEKEGGSESNEE